MRARSIPTLVVLLLANGLSVSVTSAQPKDDKKDAKPPAVDCELFEISLTNEKTAPAPDPALKPLEKKLGKPPFSAWNTRTLLSHTTKTLVKLKAETFAVKVGKTSVMLDSLPTKSQTRLQIQVDDSKGKRALNTTINIEGGDFFMSGVPEGNDTRVLALSCKATK